MFVERREIAGRPGLVLVGELDRGTLDRPVMETLREDDARGLPEVQIVDLSQLRFADSSVIALIYELLRRQPELGWVGVIAPSRGIMRVLELGGLADTPRVRIFSDEAEAIEAVRAVS